MTKITLTANDPNEIIIKGGVTPFVFHTITPELAQKEFGDIISYLQNELSIYEYDSEEVAKITKQEISKFHGKIKDEGIEEPTQKGNKVEMSTILGYLSHNNQAIKKRIDIDSYEEKTTQNHNIETNPYEIGLGSREIEELEIHLSNKNGKVAKQSKLPLRAYAFFMGVFLEERLAICEVNEPIAVVGGYVKELILADQSAVQFLVNENKSISIYWLPKIDYKASYGSDKKAFTKYKKRVTEYYREHIQNSDISNSLEFINNHIKESLRKFYRVDFKITTKHKIPITITDEVIVDDPKKFYEVQNLVGSKDYQQVNEGKTRIYKKKNKIPLKSNDEII